MSCQYCQVILSADDCEDGGFSWSNDRHEQVPLCRACYMEVSGSDLDDSELQDERKAIKKMAHKWLEQAVENKTNNVTWSRIGSISKIDGVNVNAAWKLVGVGDHTKYPYLDIEFDSKFLTDHRGDAVTLWSGAYAIPDIKFKEYKDEAIIDGVTVDMMADMIEVLLTRIKKVNYDRMRGLTERKYKSSVVTERKVFDLPNVKHENIDMCCVCHELTKHKTNCGHHLCWQCWSNLKILVEDCACNACEPSYQECPICRKSMDFDD